MEDELESSIFAFSAASLSLCRAIGSRRRSMLCPALEILGHPVDDNVVEVVSSQVGVPVSDSPRNTPSPSSRIEMSNVPPPRS